MATTQAVPRDRQALTEALAHLSYAAQRCVPKVGNGTLPTPWDKAHAQIDDLLTLLELSE